ncbi:TRAFAC clade GTPase domain-containing protein [Calothrix sp. NIES-2098]|uniref:TRAFAC clade GTPase domain-containing protein n=1 Tax=Calothrix sp. NIES-2098 TaxID=1954171 RepID=UPI000B5F842F|nr:hypothetical protein NIES2098_30660 [Calothrix sp. NIES-2098]
MKKYELWELQSSYFSGVVMNNYSVIVLGSSGSGKTVFLASLFKALSTLGKFGFFLDVEDSDRRKSLNKVYETLIRGESWPPGTRNTAQWIFNCCVKTSELSNVRACSLIYVDYAGGLITDASTTGVDNYREFESLVENSDAVLAIIDGQKLLFLMQDKDLNSHVVLRWLHEDLPNITQMVDKCTKNTPVHFIISKWDILEENGYSLAEVRNRLIDTVPEFKNVVGNRKKAGCPVRLIPVSSVGRGFAILTPDGHMKKVPGKIPQPMNVEVPLAFALTDKQRIQIDDSKPKSNSHQKSSIRKILFYILMGIITILLLPWSLIIAAVYFLIRIFTKDKQNSAQTASDEGILSNTNAFAQVLHTCQSVQQQFLANFPESNL